jgi:hypothetical protein
VGAVFNRDFPGNRGRRPLPPTINFYLNDLEFYVVSYERRRWPEQRPVKSEKNYIFVINDVVSYERRLWPKIGQFNQKKTTFL